MLQFSQFAITKQKKISEWTSRKVYNLYLTCGGTRLCPGMPRTIKYKCAIIAHHERKVRCQLSLTMKEKPEKWQFRPVFL